MLILLPKNLPIDKNVILEEFMMEYDSEMDTTDDYYSSVGTKKGDWVSLKKNSFAAVHFLVNNEIDDKNIVINIHEGSASKIADYLGVDLWGDIVYSGFFKDVKTQFIYWLMKKYNLTKDEIKMEKDSFIKNLLILIVISVVEFILFALDDDDYSFFGIIVLIVLVIFVISWIMDRIRNSKIARETGIEVV